MGFAAIIMGFMPVVACIAAAFWTAPPRSVPDFPAPRTARCRSAACSAASACAACAA